MFPMLGGKVVEGEQRLAVLAEALDSLLVLDAIAFDEAIECSLGVLPGLRHPDVLQCTLGLCLQALGQLVQDIRRLVHPAALRTRLWPYLIDRLPEAQRPVGDGELRPCCQTAPLEIEQQLLPGLRALADAVGKPDEFLLAFGGGADDHEQTLRVIFEPGLDVDAIGPEVDISLGRQVAIEPAGVFVYPGLFQTPDGRSRQPAGVLAEQRAERLLEVAGRDALQRRASGSALRGSSCAARRAAKCSGETECVHPRLPRGRAPVADARPPGRCRS